MTHVAMNIQTPSQNAKLAVNYRKRKPTQFLKRIRHNNESLTESSNPNRELMKIHRNLV